MSFLKRMWVSAPVATLVLAVALIAGLFFGARAITSTVYWSDPAHRDQDIAAWMTPGYVAKSWNVPRAVMLEALAQETPGATAKERRRNLQQIAEVRGVSVEVLIVQVEQAIAAYRASATPPEGAAQ